MKTVWMKILGRAVRLQQYTEPSGEGSPSKKKKKITLIIQVAVRLLCLSSLPLRATDSGARG